MGLLTKLIGAKDEERDEFAGADAMKREIARLRGAYLQLMKDCLIGAIYRDPGYVAAPAAAGEMQPKFLPERREFGVDWPSVAHSMIGNRRMLNLWQACEDVIAGGVPGDFIETGVWRGGACIFMRAILKTYGVEDRTVWVADSFEGLPPPNEEAYPQDRGSDLHASAQLAVSLENVRENFRAYGLLDDRVRFLQGWFKDTLHAAPIERLALLRLDGDMYESTMDALRALYHKVSPGGYVIVDDLSVLGCNQAVKDFRDAHGIVDPMQPIDASSAYWRKGPR
jgi:macrocin-O-methyltransferase TylF-like protien